MATQLQNMQFTALVMTGTANATQGVDYTLSPADTIQFAMTEGPSASIHTTTDSSSYWIFDGGISSYALTLGSPRGEAYVMYGANQVQLAFKTQANLGGSDLILCLQSSG